MCTKVEIQRYMKREEEREICRSIDPRRLEKTSSGGLAVLIRRRKEQLSR